MKHILIKCTKKEKLSRLFPLILIEKGYDVIDIFADSNDRPLSDYCKSLEDHYSKVKYHDHPVSKELMEREFIANKGDFYILLSEEIVFIETGTFTSLFKKKEENPDIFAISPLIVNNWIGCYCMQNNPKYKFGGKTEYSYSPSFDGNDFIYSDGEEAERVHNSFIDSYNQNSRLTQAHVKDFNCCARHPIDCICWSGDDMSVLLDEYDRFNCEPFFTFQYPMANGRENMIMGNKIVANYGYNPQIPYLDSTDIMKKYDAITEKRCEKNEALKSYVKWCRNALEKQISDKNITLYHLAVKTNATETIKNGRTPLYLNCNNNESLTSLMGSFDNSGSNISSLYPYYGNLTGIYWAMKHAPKNIDYVGIELEDGVWDMDVPTISKYLDRFDIILPNQIMKSNNCEIYSTYHSPLDILALENIVKEYFPEYGEIWDVTLKNEEKMGFVKNCIITKRQIFIDMWSFVFEVIDKFRSVLGLKNEDSIREHVKTFSNHSAPMEYGDDWQTYQNKMFEFMAERLMTLYLYKHYTDIGLGAFILKD